LHHHAYIYFIFSAEAVPKKILELMNVPGLTRENVASHLQVWILAHTAFLSTIFLHDVATSASVHFTPQCSIKI
jgi:hypothetical protein